MYMYIYIYIYIYISYKTNISRRSKDDQKMKFGQLIKHNMRNIFLKNHTQNLMEKLVPDSFYKENILKYEHIWINNLTML